MKSLANTGNAVSRLLVLGGLILSITTLLLPASTCRAEESAYGAFSLFPQGSSRVMGMGGAFAALSDDATGLIYNPAGLSLGNWKFDAGGTHNKITNKEIPLTANASQVYGLPYSFIFYGVAARIGTWVLGAGYSSPYNLDLDFITQRARLQIISGDVAIAKSFNKTFGVGVTLHTEKLSERFQDTATGADVQTAKTGFYPSYGASFRGKRGGFGAAYSPARRFDIDTSLNQQLGNGMQWFRDVVIPAKTTIGAYMQAGSAVKILLDVDFVDAIKDAVYVGSALSGVANEIPLVESRQTVVHGGFEWQLVKQDKTEVIWRAGAYREPPRIVNGKNRDHFTMGLEVRFGPAVLGVAFDQASGFNNTSQGFSVSLGSI